MILNWLFADMCVCSEFLCVKVDTRMLILLEQFHAHVSHLVGGKTHTACFGSSQLAWWACDWRVCGPGDTVGCCSLSVSRDSTWRGLWSCVISVVSQGSSLRTLKFINSHYHIKHDLHKNATSAYFRLQRHVWLTCRNKWNSSDSGFCCVCLKFFWQFGRMWMFRVRDAESRQSVVGRVACCR